MELLRAGASYTDLPGAYVIFICDFDPFAEGKYIYTFETRCLEAENVNLRDESRSIFLSTCGKNEKEVPGELVKFLAFVKADLQESAKDFQDDFVQSIQQSIQSIKCSREMEERFMSWHRMLCEERAEGKAEGKAEVLIEILEEHGEVSEDVRTMIMGETDLEVLDTWIKRALKAKSLEQFISQM